MEETILFLVEDTFFTALLCGIIFCIVAVIFFKNPPQKINHFYGYRTSTSMKNQEVWDFSQRFSSQKMLESGIQLIIISFLPIFFKIDEVVNIIIALLLCLGTCIYIIVATEKAIKKNFPNF
ncbi:SdpI family protein [Flavobacterium sp.]|uniref:SdpI family protein n=1 Tax=Flavobacterium sp. TaxID=239 RepID=UPI0026035F8D|nr:SdpI family protein [Flavobacterium sp.]MDD3004329.1 SdpI family protein [Flavobacterium sp.]